MEERIARLEAIIHKLLCCDNSLLGPQGPQGPMGNPGEDGIQGPPGVDGAIIFENLNWLGEFVSGVIYNQFDAVSYNGSSYFMNCESSATFETETPDMNPECWMLLANAGATGPQGPTGLRGIEGNDGSNSGRWVFNGVSAALPDPGATYFMSSSLSLDALNGISVSLENESFVDYSNWFALLSEIAVTYRPLILFQITEVGSNEVIGIYQVDIKAGDLTIVISSSFVKIGLVKIATLNGDLSPGKNYSISWSIHSLGQMAPKTIGTVSATELGENAELVYDFNIVTNEDSRTYAVYLPDTDLIGKEVIVYSKSEAQGNLGFTICSNSNITLDITGSPTGTGYIAFQGIDNGADSYYVYPNGNYKFTFLGNTAAGGTAFWSMEALPNTYPTLNYASQPIFNSSVNLNSYYIELSSSVLDASALDTLYPSLTAGEQVFAPNQPGGAKMFVKNGIQWLSFTLNPVL